MCGNESWRRASAKEKTVPSRERAQLLDRLSPHTCFAQAADRRSASVTLAQLSAASGREGRRPFRRALCVCVSSEGSSPFPETPIRVLRGGEFKRLFCRRSTEAFQHTLKIVHSRERRLETRLRPLFPEYFQICGLSVGTQARGAARRRPRSAHRHDRNLLATNYSVGFIERGGDWCLVALDDRERSGEPRDTFELVQRSIFPNRTKDTCTVVRVSRT